MKNFPHYENRRNYLSLTKSLTKYVKNKIKQIMLAQCVVGLIQIEVDEGGDT